MSDRKTETDPTPGTKTAIEGNPISSSPIRSGDLDDASRFNETGSPKGLTTPQTLNALKRNLSRFREGGIRFVPKGSTFDHKTVWEKRDVEIKKPDGTVVFSAKNQEFPKSWSQNAAILTAEKYFRIAPNQAGERIRETSVRQMIHRVVSTTVSWGIQLGYFPTDEEQSTFYDELSYILVNQMASFNSPVWFNLGVNGTNLHSAQASACFVLNVEDNMKSILEYAKTAGMIYKGGSGSGVNYSKLRSSREKLSSGGYSSGVVSFIQKDDSNTGSIKSGGSTRRAAAICILDADHGDILEFVRCKVVAEKAAHALIDSGFSGDFRDRWGAYALVPFQNANHTVRVTDEFMHAVKSGGQWALKARDGSVLEMVDAKALWNEICEAAWLCGDPGLQFDTTTNAWHTTPADGRIDASNPCIARGMLIKTESGFVPIETLDGKEVAIFDGVTNTVGRVWKSGTKPIIHLAISDGRSIDLTPDHKIATEQGWTEAGSSLNLRVPPFGSLLDVLTSDQTDWPTVEAIRDFGITEDVYDFTSPGTHAGVVNNVLVHNCGEFAYINNTACNLASLNLIKFLNADGSFAIPEFMHAIDVLITAMEIFVDGASYPTPEITKNSSKYRPLGLGYSNLGAFLMSKGLAYDSLEGRALAGGITSLMTARAYSRSAELAAKKGPFEAFAENREPMLKVLEKHRSITFLRKSAYVSDVADVEFDEQRLPTAIMGSALQEWNYALALGEEYGYRNAQVTLLAPCGTISFQMDCSTTGIEPDLSLVKHKKLVGGGSISIVNEHLKDALSALGYPEDLWDEICAYVHKNNSIVKAPHVIEKHYEIFDTSFSDPVGLRSISVDGHLGMMAAVQPFLSGAISKTCNVPLSFTPEDISKVYMQAWRMGLKSVTVYRDGCKRSQPLATKKAASVEAPASEGVQSAQESPKLTRQKLENDCFAHRHKFSIGAHEGYLHVGLYKHGSPGEVFIKMAKEGSTVAGLMDGIGVLWSLCLQYGVPLEVIVDKFSFTSFEPSGITSYQDVRFAKSPLDYVARWMAAEYLNKGEATVMPSVEAPVTVKPESKPVRKGTGLVCGYCGNPAQRAGSCVTCSTCGWTSGCG